MSLNHSDGVVSGITNGIHLEMGSGEYKEYLMDKKGIREIEQDRVKADKVDIEQAVKPEIDIEKKSEDFDIKKSLEDEFSKNFTKDRIYKQIKKSANSKKVLKDAEIKASKTETKKDDEFVKKELPKEIKIKVYDPSVTKDDELYPKFPKF